MEYQQIAAAGFFRHPVRMRAPLGVVVLERCPVGSGGFVFGTLLGPEATGPCHLCSCAGSLLWGACVGVWVGWDLCFWFPGCTERARLALSLEGVVCGVCGLGLLFENYIVDASIFYKKQFPRI